MKQNTPLFDSGFYYFLLILNCDQINFSVLLHMYLISCKHTTKPVVDCFNIYCKTLQNVCIISQSQLLISFLIIYIYAFCCFFL